jgi:hypothetical protein
VNEALKSELDLTLPEISEMKDSEVMVYTNSMHESHIEKLIELVYQVVKKSNLIDFGEKVDRKKLAEKGVLLINLLNHRTNTFSLTRMEIKNELEQVFKNDI